MFLLHSVYVMRQWMSEFCMGLKLVVQHDNKNKNNNNNKLCLLWCVVISKIDLTLLVQLDVFRDVAHTHTPKTCWIIGLKTLGQKTIGNNCVKSIMTFDVLLIISSTSFSVDTLNCKIKGAVRAENVILMPF